jgi:HlyD family secretion protein
MQQISIGDPVDVTLASGSQLKGTVRLVGERVDTQTGLVIARIALPRDPELRQGGFASARFTRSFSVLAVAEAAVHFDADGASVEVVGRDDRVHRTAVRTGRRAHGLVEIVRGPAEGSRVAVKGSAFVLDGDKVRIAGSAAR